MLVGENIRTQTEPITRNRLAQLSAAVLVFFVRGQSDVPEFTRRIAAEAVDRLKNRRGSSKDDLWLCQWILGLTNKSVQNVLRDDPTKLDNYLQEFEEALSRASSSAAAAFGEMEMVLSIGDKSAKFDWEDFTRIATTIGAKTLTIRGSEKSMLGKLFERLILGSALQILGFKRASDSNSRSKSRLFWLSDGKGRDRTTSDSREWDATVLIEPGKIVRIDIGFIGKGNPEIARDKLSRYARQVERYGKMHDSRTIIIVDRLPATQSTQAIAFAGGVDIIQMSMQFWIKNLAQRIQIYCPSYKHPILNMSESRISEYLQERLESIPIQEFVSGFTADDSENE